MRSLNKLPLLAFASLLLLAPASAQGQGSVSIALADLPGSALTVNGTEVAVPFMVNVSGTGLVCVGTSTATFPVTVAGSLGGANATNLTLRVFPASMTFRASSATGNFNQNQQGVAVISARDYATYNATVTITATLGNVGGCPATTPDTGAPATGTFSVSFAPTGPTVTAPAGEKMPGLEVGVLIVGLLAIALRRSK